MNILKRHLALLLVLAMTLTMLPMPAHADEVTEPESPSAIVEGTAEKPAITGEAGSADTANKPAENTTPAVETPKDNAVDSDTAVTEKTAADESEDIMETDDTVQDTETGEDTDAAATAESEEAEDSKADTQEETDQLESETDAPVAAAFSLRRSAVNAAADCEHENTTVAADPREEYWYYLHTDITKHVANYYLRETCDDCGATVSEVRNYFAEDHAMNADSVCSLCGYTAETASCAHSETEVAWDTKDQVISYKPISDTQHEISGYQYRYCTSCFERVGESFAATEVENHGLDANGYCGMCGYGSSSGCTHAVTDTAWDTGYPIRYAQYSLTQHEASGYKYTYCTTCSEKINNSFAVTTHENHSLDADGNCGLCGYGSGCDHSNTKTAWDYSNSSYIEHSSTHHKASGYQYTYCTDCSLRLGDSVYVECLEEHTIGSYWCAFCHYVPSDCGHANTEIRWDADASSTYTPYSGTHHKREGYQYTYCTDCSVQITNSAPAEALEEHTPDDNGTCTKCWYSDGCTHEIIWQTDRYGSKVYSKLDDKQHEVAYSMYPYCTKCEEIVGDSIRAPEIIEDHIFGDNDECDICGYTRNCTHERTRVITQMGTNGQLYPYYKKVSDTQHVACVYEYDFCDDCITRISEKRIVETSFYSDHELDARGMCKYCEACTHETKITDWNPNQLTRPNFVAVDNSRHVAKGYKYTYCAACLEQFGSDFWVDELENHTMDSEGKCTFCGYTMVDPLTATVAASGLTANKGENISATVSVVGGTGGYRFSWKILKDGSVVAENPITTSASCGYNANEEGSYVFQVTVTDSDGNTVTVQSSAITVGHACQYETVSSTKLVIQSETHHTVETTTYEECTICYEKRNEVTDVDWVEHTPMNAESYGHEAAHPHKKYSICECGAHPYLEGQFHTANGKVQEESVCCICHGHEYGAEVETSEGTRQKTCANCGITTVTHTHEYELVQTTKLVNPDATKHCKETTSEQKCKTCGHTKPGITVTIDEPHSPKNPKDYTYRSGHPHQRYAVCECGKEFDVQDEYKTANGKVQEPDVCCICHGHKFGEPTEGYGGDLYKTCKNCYFTEVIASPAEPEENTCDHVYNLEGDATKHPHEIKRVCMRCRAEESFNYTFFDCCQCVGHDWGDVVRLPDGKTYQIGCFRCNYSEKVKPSSQIEDFYGIVDIITERHDAAKQYQEEHEIDSASSAIWKTIAGQATDKLSKGGFVGVNEVLNTYSDMTGSIKGFFEEDDWNQQQIDLWESLLIALLKKEYKEQEEVGIKSEDIDYWSGIAGTVEKTSEFVAEQLEDNKDAIQKSINELDKWILEAEEKANILLRDGDSLASNDMLNKSHKLRDLKEEYEKSMESTGKGASSTAKWMKGTTLLMDAASIIAAGTEAESAVRERNNALMDLLKNDQSFTVLSSIIESADAAGVDNLKEAAERLKTDLEIAKTEAFSEFFSENDAFWKGAGLALLEKVGDKAGEKAFSYALTKGLEKAGVKAAGTVVKDSLFFLSVVESGAKGLKAIVDWGDAYTEAQKLMTINYMDAKLNVVSMVREQKAPYIADLWGMLNAEGCTQAQVFLKAWEDGTGLNSKDFGIDNGGWFRESELPDVLDQLNEERDFYIDELNLPLEKSK